MRLDAIQQLRMEQKLRLAPRMIQSMEILQLNLTALEERIEQEMEKNPVLELKEPENDHPQAADAQETDDRSEEQELVIGDGHGNQEDFKRLDNIKETITPEDFSDRPRIKRSSSDESDPKMQALANTAAREISLHEYLILQWDLVEADPVIKNAGEAIINHIEPDGYLKTSFEELAGKNNLPDDPSLWEKALSEVQKLEPAGTGARDPRECLLLQLGAMGQDHNSVRQLIANYFHELQNREYQKISRQTGYSVEQIKQSVEFIKSRLVLHPGLAFGSARVGFIVPDVTVDYNDQGDGYIVTVPHDSLPQLYISGYYRKMLKNRDLDNKTRKFIKNNMQSAQWLIDAVVQRRQTLRRVTENIVEAQKEFLESGPKFLKPLPMAQIADQIGVHIATVSRAVSGKYVQTPRGIYPLRSFFTGGTENESGDSVSWDAIRENIKELIDSEDKQKPLADDRIVKLLEKQGITLARRTVAKYRKVMNIPSSHRRREK